MKRLERIIKDMDAGEFDSLLHERYGDANFEMQKQRWHDAADFYGKTYGYDRKINAYAVPYSVLLAGDGSDIAMPTDMDALIMVSDNGTNITRLRCRDYTGEDNVDLYQHGPYTMETEFTTAVVRGVLQAFNHFKYNVYGLDMYVDADTLPGSGLDEAAHLAMTLAYVFNDVFNDGKLTERQLAEAVQWTLANYVMVDSYATDVYSTLQGKVISGDFTNADAEVISDLDLDMCSCSMYAVNIGLTNVDVPEEEVDRKLDTFLAKLGKEPDSIEEKEFYSIFGKMEGRDKEAALFLMDYYTQENFAEIYAENAVDGIGSPSVERSLTAEKDSVGGAIKWHNKVYNPYWMALCCVKDNAVAEFKTAMEKQFGAGCVKAVTVCAKPAAKILG